MTFVFLSICVPGVTLCLVIVPSRLVAGPVGLLLGFWVQPMLCSFDWASSTVMPDQERHLDLRLSCWGPVETVSVIVLPTGTEPPFGSAVMTVSFGTVSEGWSTPLLLKPQARKGGVGSSSRLADEVR